MALPPLFSGAFHCKYTLFVSSRRSKLFGPLNVFTVYVVPPLVYDETVPPEPLIVCICFPLSPVTESGVAAESYDAMLEGAETTPPGLTAFTRNWYVTAGLKLFTKIWVLADAS
jgi:hypothetical protein